MISTKNTVLKPANIISISKAMVAYNSTEPQVQKTLKNPNCPETNAALEKCASIFKLAKESKSGKSLMSCTQNLYATEKPQNFIVQDLQRKRVTSVGGSINSTLSENHL